MYLSVVQMYAIIDLPGMSEKWAYERLLLSLGETTTSS